MLKLSSKRPVAAVVTAAVAFSILLNIGLLSRNDISYASAESEGFVITDYHVDVTVTEERVYKITENISCDFSEYKHGIYRCIPTSFRVNRADGSSDKMTALVRGFDANTYWEEDDDYEPSSSSGSYCAIRLGDPDDVVIGKQDYTISYDYVCSPDTLSNIDEFYFNIIGSGWDTDIEHVTFNVNMPADFNSDKVGFSMGYAGTAGVPEGELAQAIVDTTISGETLRSLSPGEALTVRVELPDGYFIFDDGIKNLWSYIIVALLTIASAVLCFLWGRDEKIIPVVQFKAPEGYNSLDVGVMDHLDANDSDILSLLVYLADKGYLAIEPIPDRRGNIEKSKKFRFHKLREYDGKNACEAEFMDGLFGGRTTVESKDLEDSFYQTIQSIGFMEKDFTSTLVWRKGRIPITFFILAGIALLYLPTLQYGGLFDFLAFTSSKNQIALAGGIACIIIMVICWGLMQRRTPLGVELAGKARGFAEFIETAEKDRIEQMIEEDPQSFYKVIPYAMALGVTDKWIKKFKGITIERPSWYMYDTPYIDGYIMGSILGSTLQNTMQDVSAAPESSGGGGFSGGGAGGGGGGSW